MPRGNLSPDEMAFQLGLLEPRHPSNGRGRETGAQQTCTAPESNEALGQLPGASVSLASLVLRPHMESHTSSESQEM